MQSEEGKKTQSKPSSLKWGKKYYAFLPSQHCEGGEGENSGHEWLWWLMVTNDNDSILMLWRWGKGVDNDAKNLDETGINFTALA